MKNIKVSSKFVNLLKKGVSIGLVVTTVASFTACSDSSYTTENGALTNSITQLVETNTEKKYTVEELDEVELWDVRDFNGKIVPMIIKVDYTYYMGFGYKCCCEIKDFETDNTLVSNTEYYDNNKTEKIVRNRNIEDFGQQYGSVEHTSSVYISLVEKFGQKPEYTLTEIMSIREDRLKELANEKEGITCKQEVTTVPTTTKVVEQTEKTTVPATTIPANATMDEVAALRHYGEHDSTLTINNKKYRVYADKNKNSEFLVSEETFKEIIPSGKYTNLFYTTSEINYVVGLRENGDIDKIFIDQNEKTKVETILEDTNYTSGFINTHHFVLEDASIKSVPYLYAYPDIRKDSYGLINLDTNVIEFESGEYSLVVNANTYSLGMKNNGDIDKIMHDKEKSEIINVAKNTGYDAIAGVGIDEFILFNKEEGKENGKIYTLIDDQLVLTENVKKKER